MKRNGALKWCEWWVLIVVLVSGVRGEKEWSGDPIQGQLHLFNSIAESLITVGNPLCRNSTLALVRDLKNFTLWAVEMFEATAKFPGGFLSGSYYRMGDFDECQAVQVNLGDLPEGHSLQGQYCLTRFHLQESNESKLSRLGPEMQSLDPYALRYPPRSSAWETIEFKGDRSKHRRDWIYWAFCIPSTCSAKEFEKALNQAVRPVVMSYGIEVEAVVDPVLCQVRTQKQWHALDYAFCVLVGAMILLAATATFYDMYLGPSPENLRKDKGFFTNLLICFSVKNNLLHLPRKRENAGGLNIMFGIRFISTASIIVSHKFLHVLLGPIQNPGYIEETNRDPSYTWFLHGDLVVDTFFTSGAFLLSYFLTKQLEKKDVGMSMLYLFRYIRLTPVLIAVMFFYSTILNKIGSGPLWEKTTAPEMEKCIENWWTNVLYINNYVNSDRMCMSHSWYLPCDTHFFVIGVPLVILLKKRQVLGITLLCVTAILSVLIPFAITFYRSLDATLLVLLDSFLLNEPINNEYLLHMYYPSHSRAGPYIVGLIAGYIHCKYNLNERKMSRFVTVPLVAGGGILVLLPMFYAAVFYSPGRPYFPVEAALYAGLHRMLWGCGIAVIIIGLSSGNLGWINFILSNKIFIVLGKLTYSAYLCHLLFDLISLGIVRQPFYLSTFNMVSVCVTDLVYSHAAALVLYLMIECPFRDLATLIFTKGKDSK